MRNDNFPPLTPEEIGEAIGAFRSECCPACGKEDTNPKDTFCNDCFSKLPAQLQESISDNARFIAAFHPAMAYLKKNSKDGDRKASKVMPPAELSD